MDRFQAEIALSLFFELANLHWISYLVHIAGLTRTGTGVCSSLASFYGNNDIRKEKTKQGEIGEKEKGNTL